MNPERSIDWKLSFNPDLYESRVSSFGAKVINSSGYLGNENQLGRECQQAVPQFNSRGYNHHYGNAENTNFHHEYKYNNDSKLHVCSTSKSPQNLLVNTVVPRIRDILGANAAITNHTNIPTNIERNQVLETKEVEEFVPPTIQNILCPLLPKIKKEVKIKEEHIGWDNMFDSETLFAKEPSNKGEVKKETKRKASLKTSGNSSIKKGKSKLPYIAEICKVSKTKYKQMKITELVPKKKKKATDNIHPANSTNNSHKKTSTTAIKDWLENVESENSVNEISTTMTADCSDLSNINDNIDTKAKINKHHSVQSRLVKRDGLLKFTPTVDVDKFIIHTKQSDIKSIYTISATGITHNKNIIQIKQIQTPGVSCRNHNENDQHNSFSSGTTNAGQRSDRLEIVNVTVEKNQNTKPKCIAPVKWQIPVKDVNFNIIKLSIDNVGEHYTTILKENGSIILTLIFQNGFSQLNRQYTDNDCKASGIMICSLTTHTFYYLMKSTIQQSNSLRLFLRNIMKPERTKICYEAKEIITFVASCLDLHPSIIANGIVDVKVACFLLNPDRPPQTFYEVKNAISYTPEYTIDTENNVEKTAWYMTLLNQCAVTIQQVLKENSLWDIFTGMEMRLLPILAGLEMRGLQVDMAGLDSMKDTILEMMKEVEQECYKYAGKVFQINSPLQLRAVLYDDLALDTKGNLKKLADLHPLPKLVLKYRHLHKTLATFITGIAQHVHNGVVRATWLQTAAATGRIACNNPNLQAIPKLPFDMTLYSKHTEDEQKHLQLRSVYVARQGYVFLAADFQHVECRVFAHLARDDAALLDLFTHSVDFFVALAAIWMNKRQEDISREDRERTKRIVYASMYGAGTRKLMDILDMTYDKTLSIVSSFNRIFPSLKTFGQRAVERCRQNDGILETLCGRKRKFQNISSPNFQLRSQAERQAVNFIIQGSAADLCKTAMISIEKCLNELTPAVDCHLVLQIHDELVWEVAETHLERVRECVKAAMESCGAMCGLNVPLPVAICSGKSWADMN